MLRPLQAALVLLIITVSAVAQEIPEQLRGEWTIRRIVPTRTISCWGTKEARLLIGTRIAYTSDTLRWEDRVAFHPLVAVTTIDAQKFHDDNSGGGANDSQVTFRELGIHETSALQITLTHDTIKPIDGANELPGDSVLFKDRDTVIFSVCNVYFEAHRIAPSNQKAK
jgi:hypothetical protein